MATRTHHSSGGTIRHTAEASNFDVIAYKSWKSSMTREKKVNHSFLFFKWTSWEKSGNPTGFDAQWQDGIGRPIITTPVRTDDPGYFALEQLYFFVGSPPGNEIISSIESMRMDYTFDGEKFNLVTGKNWITYIAAIVVLVIVIAVLGYWLLPLIAI